MQNILDNYTLEHVNHFLQEIGQDERRKFKEAIVATRVAGATDKSYRDYMNHLRGQEKVIRQRQGSRIMTHEEQMKLDSQRHVKFNELSQTEQAQLTAERESMWGQIPAHLQEKARKLAGR